MKRREFVSGVSMGLLAASIQRAGAAGGDLILPSLRKTAGGRPLIGVALPSRFEANFTPEEMFLLRTQFDSITPENCMKWDKLCPAEGEYRWEQPDRQVEFATANGQKVVGHTLVFNRPGNYPDWVFRDGEKEADAKLVWRRLESHVTAIMTRYKGRIHSWDVLNEFVETGERGYRETDFMRVLGEDYPLRLFKLAAELDPDAKLTYNDFGIEKPERRKAILAFVQSLRERGCKVDVVGSQSHLEIGDDVGEQIAATIRECGEIGLRCAFTELDVDVIPRRLYWNTKTREEAVKQDPYADGCPEEVLVRQSSVYRGLFEAVMEGRKHVDRVTLWGLGDGRSWLNNWPWKRVNHALLFDRGGKPKPAFFEVIKVMSGKRPAGVAT